MEEGYRRAEKLVAIVQRALIQNVECSWVLGKVEEYDCIASQEAQGGETSYEIVPTKC